MNEPDPSVTLGDVQALVERALRAAMTASIDAVDPRALHAARSRALVGALAGELRARCPDDDVVALCKADDRDVGLGMRELLHDVTVCRVAAVWSLRRRASLRHVSAALWQVESELARSSRAALIDFNKLVLGSARYKLFVGPLVADPEGFIDVLRPAAAACTGEVFAALVPHPDRWDLGAASVRAWQLR